MTSEYLRIDYFFSYWIVIWFIIYYILVHTNIINPEYKNYIKKYFNPKLALLIALFENLCILILLLLYKPTIIIVVKYIFMILVLKIIPLYLLQTENINIPHDFFPVAILFILYNVYLTVLQTSLYSIYMSSSQYILRGSNNTPFFSLLEKLGSRFSGKSSESY
jgi:hypothetical protein